MLEQLAALMNGSSQVLNLEWIGSSPFAAIRRRLAGVTRQTVSLAELALRGVRHSGSSSGPRAAAVALAAIAGWASAAPSQRPQQLELDLRSGRKLLAEKVLGSPEEGWRAVVAGRTQKVAHKDLIAIRLGPAAAPELLRVELVGGERLYGAIAGGDENGDSLELLSPVLGKRTVPIDRLQAVVQPGVHPGDQVVPDGVDEALFVPTPRGYDLVAGTLFRFGPQGVQFQTEGREDAAWYAPRKFSSLRIRGGLERDERASCTLLTRSADRIGVRLRRCSEDGMEVTFETGESATVRWLDVACVVFGQGVTHLSDLEPKEVVERGYGGEPVLRWRRDLSVVGSELMAQRRAYGRGLGVHSKSRLTYVVPAGATHFRTSVALDDSVATLPLRAHAVARVLRNDKQVFEIDDLRPGQPTRDAGLHVVEAGDTISLEVDFGEGRDLGDRVDWLLPLFLMRSGS